MLYHMHEAARLAMLPWRTAAHQARMMVTAPWNPLSYTPMARHIASGAEVFERITRSYGKPEWGLNSTVIDGKEVPVHEEIDIQRTYCHLIHFKREVPRDDPKLLVVAPVSGHYATLLRGTVETMLPDHDVYVTDWQDCRFVPLAADRFNLNDYIDYIIDFLHYLGPNTHLLAVCQPSVPSLAAVAVMSGWGDLCVPASMTLMGGPIDTRRNPTAVNKLAEEHPIEWFERNVITTVPPPYPGMGRKVYPGFIQLTNFISMNLDRHMQSMNQLFEHLVEGDDEEADKKKAFYDEYLAVMDLPAEFYLQTVETVFQKHSLPKGEMIARWHPVKTEAITRTAILCVEGEHDDISGVGQTKATLDITPNLPDSMKGYHLQKGVGHYGVFNGGRWRREIAPAVKAFIREHDHHIGKRRVRLAAVPGRA
jgi:poly(3-hydroxybutyrate) depolymerase